MTTLYIYSFLAGIFATLGVPHFVRGVTGERYNGIFSKSISSVENIIWGWVSFVIAAFLLHFSHPWAHLYRASGLFGVAVLMMAIVLANVGESRKVSKR
jgi:hypothetical protein